ncbi:hypothetical protein B0J17DRAFT_567889, partial [Rhizoctonia solani]
GKYIQACDIIGYFGTVVAAPFSRLIDKLPSLSTLQHWMHPMGYSWMREHCGKCAETQTRQCERLLNKYLYLSSKCKAEHQSHKIPPKPAAGEQAVVVWFHDESMFYAHDWRLTEWVHESKTSGVYRKGKWYC